eukprot:1843898-Rhodomonas_salina.1
MAVCYAAAVRCPVLPSRMRLMLTWRMRYSVQCAVCSVQCAVCNVQCPMSNLRLLTCVCGCQAGCSWTWRKCS